MSTAADVLALLPPDRALDGDRTAPVTGAAPLSRCRTGDMTFVGQHARPAAVPARLTAALVIVDERVAVERGGWSVATVIRSPNARLDFMRAVAALFTTLGEPGVHPSAHVAAGAALAADVTVGPLASIATEVTIGARSRIGPGVHLYPQTRIGADVVMQAGTVIGADGFGYERDEDGRLGQFPHLGGVVIEDDVRIGANACVDRGTLADTVIEQGARIDNLVHIAHNVRVGGGTEIGPRSWIAPSASLRDGIVVGSGATVALAAVVTRDVAADAVVMGSPARQAEEPRAIAAALKRVAGPQTPE